MQRKVSSLWGGKKIVLRQTLLAVTPFRGLSVFIEFLKQIGFSERVQRDLPFGLKSPNAISAEETFTAFVISVVAGARRFAHSSMLRADRGLGALLGMKRFPTDGTIRNLFKRFRQGRVVEFYEPLWAWQVERLPKREGGYSLDLDSSMSSSRSRSITTWESLFGVRWPAASFPANTAVPAPRLSELALPIPASLYRLIKRWVTASLLMC